MDCSPPGSSVHGIFQATILERVAISYSRGSSWPRDQTCMPSVSCLASRILTTVPPGKFWGVTVSCQPQFPHLQMVIMIFCSCRTAERMTYGNLHSHCCHKSDAQEILNLWPYCNLNSHFRCKIMHLPDMLPGSSKFSLRLVDLQRCWGPPGGSDAS